MPAKGTLSSAGAHIHYCPACRVNKEAAAESHDAILQYLDRRIGKRNILFNKEPFLPTVNMWNTLPIVFGKAHVDPRFFVREGIEAELNRIAPLSENGGAIIGELADTQVETSGHAKLMAKKVYSIDTAKRLFKQGFISQETLDRSKAALKTAMALMEEGKLSHSTGMICPDDGDKLVGLVLPNHVLDFEETLTDRPLDPGAVILNMETENVTDGVANAAGDGAAAIQTTLDDIGKVLRKAWPIAVKTNQEVAVVGQGTMNTPDGESLESQIENVRRALSETVGLRYPDGTARNVWTVMTLQDQVIWQHPDTAQYYATPYSIAEDGTVSFGQPEEVEQAYVVKKAGTVITNMTAEDLENIVKRNKMGTETASKTETPSPEIAKLQKEKDDLATAKDLEIAKLQKERDDLKAEQEKIRLQKEDADWDQLKKTAIPPGLVKDPADEANLRKLCKEDPLAFNAKIMANRPAGTKPEGQVHTQGPSGTDGDDAATKKAATLATIRELRSSTGRMGR